MDAEFKVGEIVTCHYKTGKYIGEITSIKPQFYLVKVRSVLNHPTQGDLHNPKSVDVPLFHERRALAHREQANISKNQVKAYDGEIPAYNDSLKKALEAELSKLAEDNSEWAKKSIHNLETLKADYFR
jgi:kinase-associated protein B